MDYFDYFVLIINLSLLLKIFIPKKIQLYVIYFSLIGFLAQYLIVGYKWQYVLLYLLTAFHIINYYFNFKKRHIAIRTLSMFVLILIFTTASLLIYYLPVPKFEIENKVYSVGYQEIFIENNNRKQPKPFYELSNLSPDTNRQLLVDIYYPSNQETQLIQLFKDAPSDWGESIVNYLNRTWELTLPTFLLSHLTLTYFDVGVDIPIDIVRDIHNMRKESWTKTEKLMNKLIQKNIKNQKAALPPEVQKVKDQLANFQIKSL